MTARSNVDNTKPMTARERVAQLLEALPKVYPDAHTELNFGNPLELLIATILSAQSTIAEKFGGKVPSTMEELRELPGVGRKTANVVLGNAFNKNEGIVVDTHVARLSQRLGLTKQKDPEKIERDLMKLVPREQWTNWSHWLIWHGRRRCYARKPDCSSCEIFRLCASGKVFLRTGVARKAGD